jgi:predicted phosphodiesterase
MYKGPASYTAASFDRRFLDRGWMTGRRCRRCEKGITKVVLRILHLSDIHFSTKPGEDRIPHDDVRQQLLHDLRNEVVPKIGRADLILIAGDIAFSGRPEEYAVAADWLEQVTTICGCLKTDVFTVPGNHDVDRRRVTAATKLVHRRLRTASGPDRAIEFADLTQTQDGFLTDKLRHYQDFAASYGCRFKSNARPHCDRLFNLGDGYMLNFVGLTTVQVCDAEDVELAMFLGQNQYVVERTARVEQVVVMHHPLDWLKDKKEAENYLASRARILITGHEHVLDINKLTNGNDQERLVIGSGAVTPEHPHDAYTYRYNILEFERVDVDARQSLTVTVHPRVWMREDTGFGPDTNRLHGRSFTSFNLKCPQFNLEAVPAIPAPESQPQHDHEGFIKLSYLFWRHLSWQQRLTALVNIECLPTLADRPPDRSIEELGLQWAHHDGKLRLLWDLVIAHVPMPKREANPFPI